MSEKEPLSRHEKELSELLFRPSKALYGPDVPVSPIKFVNELGKIFRREKGFVTLSLRGSHVLGYEGRATPEFDESDLDVGVLYDSSAPGFDPKGLLASE